ncbi:hypothetical protein S40285_01844 [Stachybotrys chlorohalonatus IBT 40285]|uniref:Uncharacterized protein n=1 Tax=Stachybotrys chlorohalonatus (strain IBT 40285) TaxID=1283841 RepID=A0A084QHA8_STAC4|nr:hypothetical protein S40285_01844 [Stachybotrys chlorohalonata IBT 40285]
MANFARSFKSPSYLSPRRRPNLAGRTFSNSSDLSLASNNSGQHDEPGDWELSAPNTPGLPAADERPQATDDYEGSPTSSPQSSRPIAIEIPKWNRIKSTRVNTPPEPLSARGELPGGYFPLHEDPSARIHHPHPFQKDVKLARHKSISLAAESSPMHDSSKPPLLAASTAAPVTSSQTGGNMPVASYLAPGFHENPLPMGKYYPSNYEQRTRTQPPPKPNLSETFPSSTSSPKPEEPSSRRSPEKLTEAEVRRRMQQYQRDMVAQTSFALGMSARTGGKPGLSLKGLPIRDLRYLTSATSNPLAPKLAPLGSPGPVTPMELESSASNYLDQYVGQDTPVESSRLS